MEAKDTVMTWKQQVECSHNPNLELRERDMCLAQAKITFPLGEQQGIEKGRKEVADFIHLNFLEGEDKDFCNFNMDKWQAFLKERGLEK